MKDSIDKLKDLVPKLPVLGNFERWRQQSVIAYDVEHGQCIGIGLWKTGQVGVQVCTMSKGTVFPEHIHGFPVQVEHLHIFEGSVRVTYIEDGEQKIINKNESVSFGKHVAHKVEALEDTELIGITMPADEAYPDGQQ